MSLNPVFVWHLPSLTSIVILYAGILMHSGLHVTWGILIFIPIIIFLISPVYVTSVDRICSVWLSVVVSPPGVLILPWVATIVLTISYYHTCTRVNVWPISFTLSMSIDLVASSPIHYRLHTLLLYIIPWCWLRSLFSILLTQLLWLRFRDLFVNSWRRDITFMRVPEMESCFTSMLICCCCRPTCCSFILARASVQARPAIVFLMFVSAYVAACGTLLQISLFIDCTSIDCLDWTEWSYKLTDVVWGIFLLTRGLGGTISDWLGTAAAWSVVCMGFDNWHGIFSVLGLHSVCLSDPLKLKITSVTGSESLLSTVLHVVLSLLACILSILLSLYHKNYWYFNRSHPCCTTLIVMVCYRLTTGQLFATSGQVILFATLVSGRHGSNSERMCTILVNRLED